MSRGASRNPEEDTFPRGTRGKRVGFGILGSKSSFATGTLCDPEGVAQPL